MDPLSALIGGGMSLIGGLFNSSSQQAINAKNLQQQVWSAEGGYLSGLRKNAEAAGFNPLAVLGQRGPNMAVQVGDTGVGNAMQRAGDLVSKIDIEKHDTELAGMKEDLMHKAALVKQTMIDNAVRLETLNGLRSGQYVPPGLTEKAKDTQFPASVIDYFKDYKIPLPDPVMGPKFIGSKEAWDWRRFGRQLWDSQR